MSQHDDGSLPKCPECGAFIATGRGSGSVKQLDPAKSALLENFVTGGDCDLSLSSERLRSLVILLIGRCEHEATLVNW